jgi:3-methyladenine DNA glycosylase AlkD
MRKTRQTDEIFPRGAKNVPELRIAAKKWAGQHKDIPVKDFEQLVTSLIKESSALKKCMGGILLGYMPGQRGLLSPSLYESWLDHTTGWGEIDAVCYGHFTAGEILGNYEKWKRLINKLSKSDNINKRRAAIVLLTKPVKQSPDNRLRELAVSVIDTLKHEKSILITKAISWLLRNLIHLHKDKVEDYLDKNKDILPRIAIRETLNKLRSGRKSGKFARTASRY